MLKAKTFLALQEVLDFENNSDGGIKIISVVKFDATCPNYYFLVFYREIL
jgi:hypothetical protein